MKLGWTGSVHSKKKKEANSSLWVMLIRLCWSINPSTSCWSIPVILFDGAVKSYLKPQYSNVELLFIALFSLMLTPEAAATLRRPWSSVLLPQRTRALGTHFTVLKLKNKSKQKRHLKHQIPPASQVSVFHTDCHVTCRLLLWHSLTDGSSTEEDLPGWRAQHITVVMVPLCVLKVSYCSVTSDD